MIYMSKKYIHISDFVETRNHPHHHSMNFETPPAPTTKFLLPSKFPPNDILQRQNEPHSSQSLQEKFFKLFKLWGFLGQSSQIQSTFRHIFRKYFHQFCDIEKNVKNIVSQKCNWIIFLNFSCFFYKIKIHKVQFNFWTLVLVLKFPTLLYIKNYQAKQGRLLSRSML